MLSWISGQVASFISMITGTSIKANQEGEKWISYFRMYNLLIEFKFLSNGQITGQNISFTDENENVFIGALVRQNLDLSKGFLSSCYIIGYQQLKETEPNPLFAGDDEIEKSKVELYSNEEYGII